MRRLSLWRSPGAAALAALDLACILAAHLGAYLLRFDGVPPPAQRQVLAWSLPLFALCTWTAFLLHRTHRIRLEFAGPSELAGVARAAALGGIAFVAMLFLMQRPGVPRSVVLMSVGLVFVLAAALRCAPRLRGEVLRRPACGRRVLVLGAGKAGEMMVREMLRQPGLGYAPVGLVDDRPATWSSTIHGVRVLGGSDKLAHFVREHAASEIILATPSASGVEMRRLVARCQAAGVPYRTVPGMREILDGRVTVGHVRPVRIEDLLGREPVFFDAAAARGFLAGRRVLVTGAAGSIGSELCRQILALGPDTLVVLDQNETALFHLDRELGGGGAAVEAVLCDVTHRRAVARLLRERRPHVVFHAAAYKHVPVVEGNPAEGVRANVFGTLSVADAAEACGAEAFVLISTDKAVAPVSAMGASKHVAGLVVQARAGRSATRFVTVRFGNVLGSQGSVLGIFQEQIRAGGPVTVTDPDMKRYFMTIPEAVQLILQAALMGRGGEVFILDMGDPVRIEELARHMIRLSGLEPDRDIRIEHVGLRPGERLEEKLWTEAERPRRTPHPRILVAQQAPVDAIMLRARLRALERAAAHGDCGAVLHALGALVPDYAAAVIEASPGQERRRRAA